MTEPATASERPPYYVWLAMRLLGLLGIPMIIVGFLYAVGSSVDSIDFQLAIVCLVVGGLIGDSGPVWCRAEYDTSEFFEYLGRRLASKGCPQCGQSVFDRIPPSGFELESARHSFWPTRICYGCGGDTTRRRTSIPRPPGD